jgi:C4-dicarboxylate transporter, DctQ subunit
MGYLVPSDTSFIMGYISNTIGGRPMKSLLKSIEKIENSIITVLLFSTTILLFVNVVMRYVFKNSTTWAEEVIRYAIVWVTFIGGSVCARNKLHVGIDIFVANMPLKIKKILLILADLCSAFFCAFITFYGYQNTMLVVDTAQKSPAMLMPMWIVYMAMPLGALLMTIRFLINGWKILKDVNDDNKDPLDMSTM